jgi:hypothetical protein
MKHKLQKHRRLLSVIGVVISVGVGLFYLEITPDKVSSVSGLHKIILTYGHSVCWLLIGFACGLWGWARSVPAKLMGYAALLAYAMFIAALLFARAS